MRRKNKTGGGGCSEKFLESCVKRTRTACEQSHSAAIRERLNLSTITMRYIGDKPPDLGDDTTWLILVQQRKAF